MKSRDGFDPLALVSKIAAQEKELPGTRFIAPYLGSAAVRLRLDGLIYQMNVADCPEECWAIMQVERAGKASFVQRAPLSMVKNYLKIFPRVRLLLLGTFKNKYWAIAAGGGTQRIKLSGPVPVQLCDACSPFDTVYCRFEGSLFFFEAVDRRRDPKIARQLRQALQADLKPENLQISGLVPQERLAYKMLFLEKHNDDPQIDDNKRISTALQHAGATLDSFWYTEGGKRASVRFQVDGRLHVVEVQANDLSVISAGICLAGQDSDFDLTSLVGVLREANDGFYFD